MPYPIYLPNKDNSKHLGKTVLAVDIGGTKTSLGIFEIKSDGLSLLREQTYPSKRESGFEGIIQDFLAQSQSAKPEVLSIGVAGPVMNNYVKLTNLDWELNAVKLSSDLGIEEVKIINDLESTAYGLAGLSPEDVANPFHIDSDVKGNMVILAPGTGLGEAGIFWDGNAYRPFATEGGHSDFAPRTDIDFELQEFLKQDNEIISWEQVVSGPGIYSIYRFLKERKGYREPDWLSENFKKDNNPAAVISHAALRELDQTCIHTMDLFVSYMAREATSLVLKHKAVGGLLLGGGIPPRIYPLLRKDLFRQQFIQNSKMTDLLEKVPINVILNSKAALIGAAYYGAYGID